jgi:hypothetical protein
VLSPATVDYGHQNVTASGTVTTSGGPVAGAAVAVSYLDADGQDAQISLTGDTIGSYSGTIPDPEAAAQEVTATVAATSSTATASMSAQLGFTMDAVTITASFAQPSVNASSTDTLSRVASYSSGNSSHPLADSTLTITSPGSFNWPAVSTTVETAADGSFSYVTPEFQLAVAGVEFSVSSAATPYLGASQVNVSLDVNQAAQIDSFTGMISADRVLRFDTCAGIPEPLANSPLVGPLDYQYSRTAHGPWKTLGAGTPDDNGACITGYLDAGYPGKFTAPLANAYYRAYAPAVPGQMSAVSKAIHLWNYPTRISGFTITPRRVGARGTVTVSGRLWRLKGKWRSDAHRPIVIEYRYKNKTYILRHLMTDSAGRFHGIVAVPRTAAMFALYKGAGKSSPARARP